MNESKIIELETLSKPLISSKKIKNKRLQKRLLTKKIHSVEIKVPSPQQIRQWGERRLPNGEVVGEVTSWETVNYKTLKPEPGGLFCQRIFGPEVDQTCACGNDLKKLKQEICPKCGVERTTSRARRYRLGYIKLKHPVVHPLYSSHRPSPLAGFLWGWSNARINAVTFATAFSHAFHPIQFFVSAWNTFNTKTFSFLGPLGSNEMQRLKHAIREKKRPSFPFPINSVPTGPFQREQSTVSQKENKNFDKQKWTPKRLFSKPKLFHQQKNSWVEFPGENYPLSDGLDFRLHLYGITYDHTWKRVEEFQWFLLYMWPVPIPEDTPLAYYRFIVTLDSFVGRTTPGYDESYPIQTGGLVFQQVLSNLPLVDIEKRFASLYVVGRKAVAAGHGHLYTFFPGTHKKKQLTDALHKLKIYKDAPSKRKPELSEKLKALRKLLRLLKNFKPATKHVLTSWKYAHHFVTHSMQASWLILDYVPVLPPGLRPITSIGGELFVSDSNNLYQKILTRNDRIERTREFEIFDLSLAGSWGLWSYNIARLQRAIHSLLKTGSSQQGRKMKSLLDVLKGKKGRFRQHLLGKRVDYSGRSVIVVDPTLKIHECGIPKQMAIELFQPFLIHQLLKEKLAKTTLGAKLTVANRKPGVWDVLEDIMGHHPVLLNRAPTLHRLGIQAFLPKLVEGKAILLHPLVCPAFNADFDGDQMAVHVPLSQAARSEAFNLLWSRHHILAPASGQPLLLPTQDMVLGCYYLTIAKEKPMRHDLTEMLTHPSFPNKVGSASSTPFTQFQHKLSAVVTEKKATFLQSFSCFSGFQEIQQLYSRGLLKTHDSIWTRWAGEVQNFVSETHAKNAAIPIESRLTLFGNTCSIFPDQFQLQQGQQQSTYIRTTPGRVVFHDIIFASGNLTSDSTFLHFTNELDETGQSLKRILRRLPLPSQRDSVEKMKKP